MNNLISKYIGIPYKHLGRDKNGLDCLGLIVLIYKEILGIKIFDVVDYDEKWSWKGRNLFEDNYCKEWKRVLTPKLWDMVLIKNGKGIINHAGLILTNGRFIHCIKAGVVISRLSDNTWKGRLSGFFEYKHGNKTNLQTDTV